MKRFLWPILCSLFIITLLYSRTFFLTETPTGVQLTPSPDLVPATTTTTVLFPPKSAPLVMPAMTYPPFTMQDKSGNWVGADNEIIEAVLQRLGYQVKWIEMPFSRALEEMKSGKYPAMTACVEGNNREEYILFSQPIASIYSVLWKKKDNPFSWTTYDDLKGQVIGASHYHYGAGFFAAAEAGKFQLDMVAAPKPEIIHFRKLLQGKTDLFICELSLGFHLKQLYSPEFDQVVPSPTGVGEARPFSFAISRKYFENHEEQMHAFVAAFNKELLAFSQEGHRRAIFAKYNMSIPMDDMGKIIIQTQP